jgi:phosphatidylglycerol:prolipoprotein diacylglycerol transferase
MHIHPVQLYEASGELLIFFILIALRGKKRFHGQVLLYYLFLYPMLRTSLEFLRGDIERGVYNVVGDLFMSTSQIISVCVALVAVSLLVYLRRRIGKAAPTPATPAEATS